MIFQHFHNEAGSFTYETNKKIRSGALQILQVEIEKYATFCALLFWALGLMELVGRQGGGIDHGLSLTAF